MKEILKRLASLAKELEENANIFVLLFDLSPSISESDSINAYNQFGIPFQQPVSDLYQHFNGVSLWWIHKSNTLFKEKTFRKAKADYEKTKKVPFF